MRIKLAFNFTLSSSLISSSSRPRLVLVHLVDSLYGVHFAEFILLSSLGEVLLAECFKRDAKSGLVTVILVTVA